ncbi:oligopeptide ABC transporter permease [Escherichia coli]|nr:oligopeptide ABC transporter permease [Escherichia coli]
MMLSKKNSETLENFSEKLEVEGAACGRTHVDVLCITVRRLPV